ncbi:hypothetical protein HYV69_04165, partial [Candidatus Uhrbacteria bacterium]|nr:hypothetical protein [Candidatus Uhrbacteria bacterium]
AIALKLGHLLIVRTVERTKYRSGNTLYIDKKTSWFARLAVIAIAIVIASIPLLKKPDKPYELDPTELFKPKPAVTKVVDPAQAPAPSTQYVVSESSGGHRHFGKLNCSSLSPEGREAVGCK